MSIKYRDSFEMDMSTQNLIMERYKKNLNALNMHVKTMSKIPSIIGSDEQSMRPTDSFVSINVPSEKVMSSYNLGMSKNKFGGSPP